MIKSILINNFQSHKETKMEFDPGVNVIAGASDAGKSSILRSLIWTINNRPSGDSIRNWDSEKDEKVHVGIQLNDNFVDKERKNSKSSYTLGKTVFEAIKTDVPSEVSEALNLSEINIQTQHDSHFLLNDSAGEVARKLNEIAGLDVIDRLFKYINGKASAAKRQAEDAEKNITQTTADIENLSYIDKLEEELNELEKRVEDLTNKQNEYNGVIAILRSVGEINREISKHSKLINAQPTVEGLLDCCSIYTRNNDKINTVVDILENLVSIAAQLEDEKDWLCIESEYETIHDQVDKCSRDRVTIDSIRDLTKRVTSITGDIIIEENKTTLLKAEYESLLKKHKICPLCGSKVDSKLINTII